MTYKNDILFSAIKLASLFLLIFLSNSFSGIVHRFVYLSFRYDSYYASIIFASIWIISIFAIIAASFHPNLLLRCTLALIFFISSASSIFMERISNDGVSYNLLNTIFDNVNFAGDVFSFYKNDLLYAIFVSLLVIPILLPTPKCIIRFPRLKYSKHYFSMIALAPFFIILALSILRSAHGLDALPNQYKPFSLVLHVALSNIFMPNSERGKVNIPIEDTTEKPNVILVVDESVRGDFLDINDNKGITPYLLSRESDIINYGLISSGSNCSAESNQIIRYGASGQSIDALKSTFNTNPYIWQFAKYADYKTIYLEGQARQGEMNDGMTKDEIKYIDNFIYTNTNGKPFTSDMNIADVISETLKQKNEQPFFMYVVKAGIHFPYDKRVPEEERVFDTASKGFDIKTREDLVNSYKNAIIYNIAPFIKRIMSESDYKNTVLIYTSDHGQNLLEDSRKITHCSPNSPSKYEGLVPLFVYTQNPVYKERFKESVIGNENLASHFQIFPTIISLMGYKHSLILENYGSSLFERSKLPRRFSAGYLNSKILGFGNKSNIIWREIEE